MQQTDKLFNLIKALTPSEKRFFKLYSNLYNSREDKNYIILFDIFDEANEYNKEVLIQSIQAKIGDKNISSIKNYLRLQIFDALRLFHRKKDEKVTFYETLATSRVLANKGLNEPGKSLLKALKKEVVTTDRHLDIILTNYQLFELVASSQMPVNTLCDFMLDIHLEQETLVVDYLKLIRLIIIKAKISRIKVIDITKNNQSEMLNDLLQEILSTYDEKSLKNSRTKYVYFRCLLNIYFNLNKKDAYFKILKKSFNFLNENSNKFSAVEKIPIWSGLSQYYLDIDKPKEFVSVMQHFDVGLKKMPKRYFNEFVPWLYFNWCTYYGNYPHIDIPKHFESEILALNNINKSHKINIYLALAECFFTRKNYEQSQEYLNDILLYHNIRPADERYLIITILSILCHIEQDNLVIAQQTLRNCHRKMRRTQLLSEEVIQFLRGLALVIKNYNNDKILKSYEILISVFDANLDKPLFCCDLEAVETWIDYKMSKLSHNA